MDRINNDLYSLKKNYVGLDIFRMISILMICAFHTAGHLNANYGLLYDFINMGAVFMTAFFMLSGYLMFINNAHKDLMNLPNLKGFFIKRFIGIIPMYLIASFLFVLYHFYRGAICGLEDFSLKNELILAPIEILGIQSNFHSLFSLTHNGGTWFISCIVISYVAYPYFQEILKQISFRSKMLILVLCSFIILYSPMIADRFHTVTLYSNPFFRLLEFLTGAVLASMKTKFDEIRFINKYVYNWITIVLVGVFMVICVSAACDHGFHPNDYLYYNLICLPCFIAMIVGFSGIESRTLSKSKLIPYCRKLGYCFFLAQLFSNTVCKSIITKYSISDNTIIILLGWTICIIISVVLHEFVEKPMTRFLKRKLNAL